MARFDYECQKCKRVVEIERSVHDESDVLCCEPDCGAIPMLQLISRSTFHLKGLGWAAEGYSKNGVD